MIVIDTHAVVWLTQERTRLSAAAERVLIVGRNEGSLAISDVTLREIAMLITAGSVTVSSPMEIYLRFVESLFTVLPVNAAIAVRSVQFGPAYPKDPVDQLIGATAIVHGAKLVTRDGKIRASGEVNCVW